MMLEIKSLTDINALMEWREEVILNVFGETPSPMLLEANRRYYQDNLPKSLHLAFEAFSGDEKCGCGAVCFSEELPSPDNPTGYCAYLMNIYVREPYRNKGVAHQIVRRLIDEAHKRNCGKIYLETTAEGKPLYKSLGFNDLHDMMKLYDDKI